MDITLKDKNGVTLHTAKKHCKEDITVRVETQEIEITPSVTEQVEEGLFNKVTVQGVTADIDENIKAENIKVGTNILGVEGSYEGIVEDLTEELTEQDNLLSTQEITIDNIITALEGKSAATPRSKNYEITLPKASGKILLLELDNDVLAHIDDPKLTVTLINVSGYSFEKYSVAFVTISNTVFAVQGDIQMYGMALRQGTETGTTLGRVSCPANNTDENIAGSNIGWFILNGRNYYVKPADGFMRSGTYKLTFSW